MPEVDLSLGKVLQPWHVVAAYPTTILCCQCNPDPAKRTIIILIGLNSPAPCIQCRAEYRVVGVDPNCNPVVSHTPARPLLSM